jgi:transposase
MRWGRSAANSLELVSPDMASWISRPIVERVPQAVRWVDRFHVVLLPTEALDDVRRCETKGAARATCSWRGSSRRAIRGLEEPREPHRSPIPELAWIQQTNARLYRAYLLKEQLRQIYRLPAKAAGRLLDRCLTRPSRYRIPSFVKLVRTSTDQQEGIIAAIYHGLSNARIE